MTTRAQAVAMLNKTAKSLVKLGYNVKLDTIASAARLFEGDSPIAYVRSSDNAIVVMQRIAWDGFTMSPVGPGEAIFGAVSAWADTRIRFAIKERSDAYGEALAECPHFENDGTGVCNFCKRAIPIVPEGVADALKGAKAEMAARGFRGEFICRVHGAKFRVTWLQDFGSRVRDMERALRCAAEHLRAAGLNADAMPGIDCIYLSPVAVADERTCLDSARADEPVAAE